MKGGDKNDFRKRKDSPASSRGNLEHGKCGVSRQVLCPKLSDLLPAVKGKAFKRKM
jgi:hypothetical protein